MILEKKVKLKNRLDKESQCSHLFTVFYGVHFKLNHSATNTVGHKLSITVYLTSYVPTSDAGS